MKKEVGKQKPKSAEVTNDRTSTICGEQRAGSGQHPSVCPPHRFLESKCRSIINSQSRLYLSLNNPPPFIFSSGLSLLLATISSFIHFTNSYWARYFKVTSSIQIKEPIPALKEFPTWYNLNVTLQKALREPVSQVTLGSAFSVTNKNSALILW